MSSFAEDVDRFFADPDVQRIIGQAASISPLQVCYPTEIHVSRFLAWILDPSQGHGLGNKPLRRLLAAAWRNSEGVDLTLAEKRALSPSAIDSKSFEGCVIHKELRFERTNKRLDVLVLDPKNKLLIAIEHKFGAKQGEKQLTTYSKELKRLYRDWKRVSIFLDLYGEEPDDPHWIGLNYDWLVHELTEAEDASWLGSESKRALSEFKQAIDLEHEPYAHLDTLAIVKTHRSVFKKMNQWHTERKNLHAQVRSLFQSSRSIDDVIDQRLFPVYWQRRELWQLCFPKLEYANILEEVRRKYSDIESDPKRKVLYFWLPKWCDIAREGAEYWPLQVRVGPDVSSSEEPVSYVVLSFINMEEVKEDYKEGALKQTNQMRSLHMKRNPKLKDEPGLITLKVDRGVDANKVTKKIIEHIGLVQKQFSQLWED